MITLNYVTLKNHLLFKDLHWQLDKYPLSVIRGLNKDQRIITSNGVGKTILPSTLTAFMTDAPPMAVKKKSTKELVKGKAEITYGITKGSFWKIRQFSKANSVKYEINRNNKPQKVKTIDRAREIIADILPLSTDHVFSQFYISSYRPSVLLYGQASSRLSYFEQIFDLRIYDQLRKAVLKDLQVVNQSYIQSELLIKQKTQLQDNLGENVNKQLDDLKQQHKNILKQYSKSHKSAQKLMAYVTLFEQLHSKDGTLEELLPIRSKIKTSLEKTEISYQRLQKQLAAIDEAKKTNTKREKLNNELKTYTYNKHADKKYDRLYIRKSKIEESLSQFTKFEEQILRYRDLRDKYTKRQTTVVSVSESDLNQLKYELQQKAKLKPGASCPLCQQIIPHTHKNTVKKLKKQINRTTHLLQTTKDLDFIKRAQAKLPARVLSMDLAKQHQKLEAVRKKLQNLTKQQISNRRYLEIKQLLKHLPKAQPIKQDCLDANLANTIEKQRKALYRIDNDIDLWKKINKLKLKPIPFKMAKKRLLKEQSIVAIMAPKLEKVAELLQVLGRKQADYKSTQSRLDQLSQELNELGNSLAERDILEALAKAYSNKGIRILQVQSLASLYIKTLNRYASYIYPMPIEFSAEVGPNKFDILAKRNGELADIRSLSGAESRQFLALSALALCSLMPNHLRMSVIIFDEIEAGMSLPNRKKFVADFIPLVQKIVPYVVLVTPYTNEEFYIPHAKNLTLVRQNNITRWQ